MRTSTLLLAAHVFGQASAQICTTTTDSWSNVIHTWTPVSVPCPEVGGVPTVVAIQYNMGGTYSEEDTMSAVQLSLAATNNGTETGLALASGRFDLGDVFTPETGSFAGSYGESLCTSPLNGDDYICDGTSYNAQSASKQTTYFSVWNTGDCEGTVEITASIREFDAGQGATCDLPISVLNPTRSGDADDLYCSIGGSSSTIPEIFCGSVAAGDKCMAVGPTYTTISILGFSSTSTSYEMSCVSEGNGCSTVEIGEGGNFIGLVDADTSQAVCEECDATDCFGAAYLNPTSGGIINSVPVLVLAAIASLM